MLHAYAPTAAAKQSLRLVSFGRNVSLQPHILYIFVEKKKKK